MASGTLPSRLVAANPTFHNSDARPESRASYVESLDSWHDAEDGQRTPRDLDREIEYIKELLGFITPQPPHVQSRVDKSHRKIRDELDVLRASILAAARGDPEPRPGSAASSVKARAHGDDGAHDDVTPVQSDSTTAALTESKQQITRLEGLLDEAQLRIREQTEQNASLVKERSDLQQAHDAKIKSWEQAVLQDLQALNKGHESKLREAQSSHEAELARFRASHDQLLEAAQVELADTRQAHKTYVAQLATRHDRALSEAKNETGSALAAAQKAHNQKTYELGEYHNRELVGRSEQHEKSTKDLQAAHEEELARLSAQLASARGDVQRECGVEAQRLKDQLNKQLQETRAMEQSHRFEIAGLKQEHKQNLADHEQDASAAHAAALEQLRRDHERDLENAKRHLDLQHAEQTKAYDKRAAEHNAAFQALQSRFVARSVEYENELGSSIGDLEAQLELHKDAHSLQIAELQAAHATELREMAAKNAANVLDLQSGHETLLNNMTATHDARLKALEAEHAHSNVIDDKDHVSAFDQAKREHTDHVTALAAQSDARLRAQQKSHDDAVATLGETIQGLRAQIDELHAELAGQAERHAIALQEAAKAKEAEVIENETKSWKRAQAEIELMHRDSLEETEAAYQRLLAQREQEITQSLEDRHRQQLSDTVGSLHDEHAANVQSARDQATKAANTAHLTDLETVKLNLEALLGEKDQLILDLRTAAEQHGREMTALQEQHRGTQAALETAHLNNESASLVQIQSSQRQLNEALASRAALEQQLSEHSNHLQLSRRELAQHVQQRAEAEEKTAVLSRDVDALTEQLAQTAQPTALDTTALTAEIADLKQRLSLTHDKRREAERMRDALLARSSSLFQPLNKGHTRRAASHDLSQGAGVLNAQADANTQLVQTLRSNDDLRAQLVELRSVHEALRKRYDRLSGQQPRASRDGPATPARVSSSQSQAGRADFWPTEKDLTAARDRIIGDYKRKLDEVVKEKASLEANLTERYAQELAAAKAQLVEQHRVADRAQAQPGTDEADQLPAPPLEPAGSTTAAATDGAFRQIVSEYDRRVAALLRSERSATDLTIQPAQFEERARRSADLSRAPPTDDIPPVPQLSDAAARIAATPAGVSHVPGATPIAVAAAQTAASHHRGDLAAAGGDAADARSAHAHARTTSGEMRERRPVTGHGSSAREWVERLRGGRRQEPGLEQSKWSGDGEGGAAQDGEQALQQRKRSRLLGASLRLTRRSGGEKKETAETGGVRSLAERQSHRMYGV